MTETRDLQAENERLTRRIESLEQEVAELRQHVGWLTTLFERAFIGVATATLQGKVMECNPAFQQLIGYSSDELRGMSFKEFTHPEDVEIEAPMVAEIVQGRRDSYKIDKRYIRKDGQVVWVRLRISLIHDEQGTPVGLIGIIEDITEQRNFIQRMRTFHALAENAPDGVVVANLDGTITYANAACRAIYGYGDEVIGLDIAAFAQESHERIDMLLKRLGERGFWQGIVTHQRTDGSTFPTQVSTFYIYDNDGNPQAFASINHDVTEQMEAEKERAALQEQVIAAQRAALRELSTPLLPLADNLVAMPLVGSVDTARVQQVMETLLEGIATYQADFAILDITGVPVVDTQVADALIRSAQAVRLLGAQIILTGIGSSTAQTLVTLGADLSSIITRSTLQSGIAYVFSDR